MDIQLKMGQCVPKWATNSLAWIDNIANIRAKEGTVPLDSALAWPHLGVLCSILDLSLQEGH